MFKGRRVEITSVEIVVWSKDWKVRPTRGVLAKSQGGFDTGSIHGSVDLQATPPPKYQFMLSRLDNLLPIKAKCCGFWGHDSPANEILQHRALARRLATHNGYLRKIKLHMHTQLRKRILQLVHYGDELFHPRVARHGRFPNQKLRTVKLVSP